MNKLLITGSAGFIGFHLAKSYLDDGIEVTGLDCFNNYYPSEIKEMRNTELARFSNFHSLRGDVSNHEEIVDIIKKGQFDAVCHLAAQAGVRFSLIDPIAYATSNLIGFANILEGVRYSDSKPKLVYASSSSVYGGNEKLPFSETDRVDTPVSFYAATKKANELMAHTYSHLYDIETTGLRFFTVYGEHCRPDMMLWKFTEAIARSETVYLYNEGKQQRSFTYVGDIVSGIKQAINKSQLKRYNVYNLGNDKSRQLTDVISLLEKALGKKANIKLLPPQAGDMKATWADISKANKDLNFDAKTTFEDCVSIFVKWYLNNPEAADIVYKWRKNSDHT